MPEEPPISDSRQPGLADHLLTPNLADDLVYDKNRYTFWGTDVDGKWVSFTQHIAETRLAEAGLSPRSGHEETVSEVDREILRVINERGVDYAGPLSGYRTGIHLMGDKRILVTRSFALIQPQPGDWSLVAQVIDGLLGTQQSVFFRFWLKHGYSSLAGGFKHPGQALVLAGPPDSGKSFVQHHIITPVLGGRACKCYRALSGKTEFNGDMFEAEHLVVDDEIPSTAYSARMAFGASLKGIVASEGQSAHYKYRDAFTVAPFWRISMTVNDGAESLLVLPVLDSSLEDKIMLFKTQRFKMPMPTESPDERGAFKQALYRQLPAFIHHLLTTPIPESMASRRFGVRHFHHPDIVAAVHEMSPEERLLQMIDAVLFPSIYLDEDLCESTDHGPQEYTAAELEIKLLNSPYKREAEKVLNWNNACGTYLGHLAKRYPERVCYHRTAGARKWIVYPANFDAPKDLAQLTFSFMQILPR